MAMNPIPHLRAIPSSKQLIVHGQPFLVRGAELQNSSFSSIKHMEPIWGKMVEMNVNTILGSVSWELIEPREGEFDFSLVDRLISEARRFGLKLILLWFGTWKNGISTYAPAWVKMDAERFPRVEIRCSDGSNKVTEILSAVHGTTVDADVKAFSALMTHLKAVDETQSTVIMVQVENEVGVLGDSRDYSEAADTIFNQPAPPELVRFLRQDWDRLHPDLRAKLADHGFHSDSTTDGKSWGEIFPNTEHADEMFMAYHYAAYVEKVARAGKSIYPLPLFANFWLNYHVDDMASQYPVLAGGGNHPGDYPSGGAVSTVLDIWKQFAPSLDFVSPDVYLNDYHRVCSTYRHRGQPLFIPEQRRDEYGARRTWAAVGAYQAIGACPFALDTLGPDTCAYTKHYGLLSQVSDVVLQAQQSPGTIVGFFFDDPDDSSAVDDKDAVLKQMGGFELTIERAFTTGRRSAGYGLCILRESRTDGTATFLLVGAGFQVKFKSLDPAAYFTGILALEEKQQRVGADAATAAATFVTRRRLNGDETRSGNQAIMPNELPDDGGFPINICIPAVTKIAECTIYRLRH